MYKLLEGSLIYKIIICINLWLEKGFHGSLIYRGAVAIYAFARDIWEASLIGKGIKKAGIFIGNQWRNNRIIKRFLSPGDCKQVSDSSIISRIWEYFHRGLNFAFRKLKLDKLLQGSIFTMPYIWSLAALALAPFLPTMLLLAVTLVSLMTLILAFGCDSSRKLAYSPVNKYVLLFAFIYIGATFTSVTVSGSLYSGALTTLFVIFAIIIQNSVTTKRQLYMMIYAFVLFGAAVSAYGVYQYLSGATGATAWLDSTMFSEIGVRVYSTLDNPNVLAMYLLLVIPFAGASILTAKGYLQKLMFTACLAIMMLCMLLTFARGGWLGLIIAAAVFLVMIDRRFIIVGIVALIVLYFTLPDFILSRFLSIGNISDSSTSYRVFIWMATIEMLKDYWFTGIGPGTEAFNRIYPIYSFNTVAAPHSHNLYLQIMCNAGIAGIVVFLICLFVYIRHLCSAISKVNRTIRIKHNGVDDSSEQISETRNGTQNVEDSAIKYARYFQIASVSSVIGFLVQGMTDYSFYNYRVTFVFWAVLGLGMLTTRLSTLLD